MKKGKHTSKEYLHPLGDKIEKVLDMMNDIQSSLDDWRISDYKFSPPSISYDEEEERSALCYLVGHYDTSSTVEEFVERTFEDFDCGSHSYVDAFIDFRRRFDEAVLKNFKKYINKSNKADNEWAKEEIARYQEEMSKTFSEEQLNDLKALVLMSDEKLAQVRAAILPSNTKPQK